MNDWGWGPPPEEELELPTGRVCRVRRPSLSIMAATGQIPNPVLATILKAASDLPGKSEQGVMKRVLEDNPADYFTYQIYMVKAALVEPRVYLPGETPPKGGVPVGNLTESEIQAIMRWIQQEEKPARLSKFRGKRSSSGAGADGSAVRDEAE
jgi:hypothetical protein